VTHPLTMTWSNISATAFKAGSTTVTEGTEPSFSPPILQGGGSSSSVFVDQSKNLHAGPVGTYNWVSTTDTAKTVACSYNHPAGKSQTTVTVTPSGFQVSFDGRDWRSTPITSHPTGSSIVIPIYVRDAV
jgi:hypothetical protein